MPALSLFFVLMAHVFKGCQEVLGHVLSLRLFFFIGLGASRFRYFALRYVVVLSRQYDVMTTGLAVGLVLRYFLLSLGYPYDGGGCLDSI